MKSIFYRHKNKKASIVADSLIVLAILFIFAISVLVGKMVLSEVNTSIADDDDIRSEVKAELSTREGVYTNTFDNIMVIAIVMFWVFLIVSSLYIDSKPVFFFIILFILILLLIVSFNLVNAYEDLGSDTDIQTAMDSMPKLNWLMMRLPLLLFFMVLSTGVALYAKTQYV